MQSRNNDIQCILAGTSGSFKQEFKHSSQACIHLTQLSILYKLDLAEMRNPVPLTNLFPSFNFYFFLYFYQPQNSN